MLFGNISPGLWINDHRLHGICDFHPPREDNFSDGPVIKLWTHAMFGFLFRLCDHLRVPSFNSLLLVYEHHFPQNLHNHSDPSPQDSFLRMLLADETGFTGATLPPQDSFLRMLLADETGFTGEKS